jgi:hypothetical protein
MPRVLVAALLFAIAPACGGGSQEGSHRRADYPPQPRGCTIRVYEEGAAPPHTANIGTVTAMCTESDSRDACLRELEDQACLMGADVLWQIEGPTPEARASGMGQRMRGRAAHTK